MPLTGRKKQSVGSFQTKLSVDSLNLGTSTASRRVFHHRRMVKSLTKKRDPILHAKGKGPTEIHRELVSVYGDGVMTRKQVYVWCTGVQVSVVEARFHDMEASLLAGPQRIQDSGVCEKAYGHHFFGMLKVSCWLISLHEGRL